MKRRRRNRRRTRLMPGRRVNMNRMIRMIEEEGGSSRRGPHVRSNQAIRRRTKRRREENEEEEEMEEREEEGRDTVMAEATSTPLRDTREARLGKGRTDRREEREEGKAREGRGRYPAAIAGFRGISLASAGSWTTLWPPGARTAESTPSTARPSPSRRTAPIQGG